LVGGHALAARITSAGFSALAENRRVGRLTAITNQFPSLDESIPHIGAPAAYTTLGYGSGGSVLIMDTGVDSSHPFFGARVIGEGCAQGAGAVVSSCAAPVVSLTPGSGAPCTYSCGHGTHVAGIAAGYSTSVFHGVAPQAQIVSYMPYSQFEGVERCGDKPSPCKSFAADAELEGLNFALRFRNRFNIKAVNMSFGSGAHTDSDCPSQLPMYDRALTQLRRSGVAVVAASGNKADDDDYELDGAGIDWPGCARTVVSVGSTGDNYDEIASDSQWSHSLDMLAPGRSIYSSIYPWAAPPFPAYGLNWGTSMAAPHVAGAFSLIAAHFPGLEVSDIEQELKADGVPVFDTRAQRTFPRLRLDAINNLVPKPNPVRFPRLEGRPNRDSVVLSLKMIAR